MGIRLADYCVRALQAGGVVAELIDAKAVDLPMLDRMYKEYSPGEAPEAMEALAGKIRGADGFVFVTGEYNWGMQPGLKNRTDHFLEEWFWRPAGIVSYSAGRLAGARGSVPWHGTLSEMGMVVISSTVNVGPIGKTLDAQGQPIDEPGTFLEKRASPTTWPGGWRPHGCRRGGRRRRSVWVSKRQGLERFIPKGGRS
ncbi:NADPH-dependent FMN reductase [Novilysobacter luteus]|uniref:NADPH-dependent FMN reductase-like domain-containing protein n=1 Tax=Novilysobacter luteus TaxID=2822368 RepID=A0ABN7QXJ0_9GAMM|nr:NAD(P)H-dependent oxidoreductase [Lysobacter luteus]CAG4971973.1 hypothetical protein LYB30171_01098 [Lysobacter luteus]